jgi:hypothetical protein
MGRCGIFWVAFGSIMFAGDISSVFSDRLLDFGDTKISVELNYTTIFDAPWENDAESGAVC